MSDEASGPREALPPPRTHGWFMQRPVILAALPAIVGSSLLIALGLVVPEALLPAIVMTILSTTFVALTSSARVDVGEDGVMVVSLLGRRRFVRWADVARVEEHEGLRYRLHKHDGTTFDIETRLDENVGKVGYEQKCKALLASIRAHVTAAREAQIEAGEDAGERVLALALEDETKMAGGPAYRARVALDDDAVRGVLRDPAAAFDARAAAAVVLKRRHGDGVKKELSLLAESTAEVELRTFLADAAEREAEAVAADLEETLAARKRP